MSKSSNLITAPLPGIIYDIKVEVGDKVNVGQVILILESMKMEMEVPSAITGTVTNIKVSKGQSVNSGDVLLVIE